MRTLNPNWITESPIDFEFKKYTLLAYLQRIERSFDEYKLYPAFSDLIFHYKNLYQLKENKDLLKDSFPKEISKEDFIKLKLVYKQLLEDDDLINAIEELIHFSIPQMKIWLERGREIYLSVQDSIKMEPIGILPLYKDEGFLIIQVIEGSFKVFRYKTGIFERPDDNYRGLNVTFLSDLRLGIGETIENYKLKLSRQHKDLPNPAVFYIHSKKMLPYDETLMPVIKMNFLSYISHAS
ncbi:hypothetical protein [Marinigracilibium pacificum]|uniref:Uncharacterized protein n=1 Tax=Marinigracilibium pacificum TaxID=2729599 RepID=A0A848J456_9BACT|nr:hypothetical protein [Marinigracilibium pacificum]NMM49310.1 hypothetical protein [Marinigracilibium pacificum]